MEFFEKFIINTGFVVETLEVGTSDEFDEILVAMKSLGQENDATAWLVDVYFLVVTSTRSEEGIETKDGFDVLVRTGLIKVYRAVQCSSVGDGERILTIGFRGFGELLGGRYSTQKRIHRVGVEVDEFGFQSGHGHSIHCLIVV